VATFYNRTRLSPSIPRRLIGDRKWHLLPLYALLHTSDLAREGIENSGSWRFADHVYLGKPSGRFLVGTALDALLLNLPSARSFRLRYLFVRDRVMRFVPHLAGSRGRPVTVLSVPCGIPRDLIEAAAALRKDPPAPTVRFVGIDLDPEPLGAGARLAAQMGVEDDFQFVVADAFDSTRYPVPLDLVCSTGFGEFLDDQQLRKFLELCRDALSPGGVVLTTASDRDRMSDYLLRELAEIRATYRDERRLQTLLEEAGFREVWTKKDRRGLQTFAVARKAGP
jgi:SAM-dependent methyltransferase